jgi:EAL domain-containing protein (putative c-di-GMP-specific phosphodiesterase class I)
MQAAVMAHAALEADLRLAITTDQLQLYLQPQVDTRGHVVGAEALLRWAHPQQGLVSPGIFIPLAEETGLIIPVGNWVMREACEQLARWSRQPETSHMTLAVNVSAKQFSQPDFVQTVIEHLGCTGAPADRLKLELTESMLASNTDDVIAKMHALKARGVCFSLDDFGTGYSSLIYLKRLPLSQLKIDQSFVRDIVTDPSDAAIARTIIALGETLQLAVIAEGVESDEQRKLLVAGGCRQFQGYLFSRPLPIDQFENWLHAYQTGGQ